MEGSARPGTIRSALRHGDFRYLVGARAVSSIGDWLYGVALIVYVQAATGSSAWVAATIFVRMLPYVLFSTFGGVLADRYDRKRLMIWADLARGFLMLGLTGLAIAHAAPVPMLVLAAGSTMFSAVYMPCAFASVPSLTGEEDLAAANALLATVDSVAIALGPAVGGVLLLLGAPSAAFAVNAVTFIVSAGLTLPIRVSLSSSREGGEEVQPRSSAWERAGEGLRAIGSSVDVVVIVALSLASTFFYGQEVVVYARAATGFLGIGESGISFMFAAVGVGGVLAATVVGRLTRFSRQGRLLLAASLASALPMMAIALVRSSVWVYALIMFEGAAVLVADVVSITLLQRLLPRTVLGRVMGILNTLLVAGILAGSVFAAVVVSAVGVRAALVIGGLSLVLPSLVAIPRAGSLDRRAAGRLGELEPRLRALRGSSLFAAASPETLEALAAVASAERVPKGTVVVRQGDQATDLYVVSEGRLGVSATNGPGTVDLGELRAGDHFGEIGLLEHVPRTATVTALSGCDLYRINGVDFLDIVRADARLPGALGRIVSSRLTRTAGRAEPSQR